MIFTKDFSTFCIEAFTLHVFSAELMGSIESVGRLVLCGEFDTYSAVKTLGVVVVVESFHPPVSSFYWESTRYTLGSEQFIPV